jgi:hypothetical protein
MFVTFLIFKDAKYWVPFRLITVYKLIFHHSIIFDYILNWDSLFFTDLNTKHSSLYYFFADKYKLKMLTLFNSV